ncbi:hypothetical protein J25TS5_33040 [Paenibacillus faecis]|uniref:Uncharacterized protein n=1 Tax=Paenibacillus faecis TaxID=862114 RepID=A0A5D0CZ43_9BACL|nr:MULTISPECIES: DUF2161 family putative PD-(D/E)XK-type phosphodiesterase [Paenibacillus]MCA1295698.1 DUF2161 family putative PD-(D/E)XK-type phosphodiesterase [Paenibacillus sp. alder61]TYA15000.1 hypothetical protein FRY98_04875 [Paenibacillus faecis]GIO86372.1 hypothetical protein J25TS5_33040 [Paenibacillus faecis]
MAVQHETELYPPLKKFFEERGYSIKSEVRHCDLVGIRPGSDQPLIVEMKKTFNLPLLLQGLERQKLSAEVYLAVERNRTKRGAHNQRWSEITLLCRRLGLGLITVTHYKTKAPFVEILCSPGDKVIVPSAKIIKTRASRLITEFNERSGDYNVGGSHGTKLVTAYRERALRVALALLEGGELAPREVRERSGVGSAAAILQRNYYGWFRRIARGRYALTPEGREGLALYSGVTDGWARVASAAEAEEPSPAEPPDRPSAN